MEIFPIRSAADYERALKSVSPLVEADPAPDSQEGNFLDAMAALIAAYEAQHFQMAVPDFEIRVQDGACRT